MKKFIYLFFAMCFVSTALVAQENPVKWSYKAEKINDSEYNLVITADIQDEWFMYSQFLASDDGPVRTSFNFAKNTGIELVGKAERSGDIKKGYDDMFSMEVIKFAHKAVFTQKVKVTNAKEIKGTVNYMCCDGAMCLPPKDVNFTIKL